VSETPTPCVLVVADPGRIDELAIALDESRPHGAELMLSTGGDDTIEMFSARRPEVVVVTATLEIGDSNSLIETLRGMTRRAEVQIVVVGDDTGPVRTALDAIDIAPDRFVSRPLSPAALRFAVGKGLEAVARVRGQPLPAGVIVAPPSATTLTGVKVGEATQPAVPGDDGVASTPTSGNDEAASTRAALRARWEALADSIGDGTEDDEDDTDDAGGAAAAREPEVEELEDDDVVEVVEAADGSAEEAAPLPPPIVIQPRRRTNPDVESAQVWHPGNTSELRDDWDAPPQREPTLIIRDEPSSTPSPTASPRTITSPITSPNPATSPSAVAASAVPRQAPDEGWSATGPLAALPERPAERVTDREVAVPPHDDLADFDDGLVIGHGASTPSPHVIHGSASTPTPAPDPRDDQGGGRDFARQLRAKMSMMAQRLFSSDAAATPAVDVGPRHDHQTEIDLAALGEEPALGGGVTEIESRASGRVEYPSGSTSPGSWDTQVRERGLADAGEIVRGVSDAPMLLAKMFAVTATGRITFKKEGAEKVVYFDQGRPVFASSDETGDRMGELLVREGKITAAQYERCQSVVAASGRRMGEILVDFGYLKRRELLPAVRRHVEDIVYSLFSWDRGTYQVVHEPVPSSERIRLSRHAASLVLEGIRRKLDRSSLERLIGPASTVIEVPDRERLGGIVNTGDLTPEERAALAAFDGQADLAQVARAAGLDVTDLLPFAWGLCVLGLATARRAESDVLDESTALVGETDLAIDRERVRARWQLVTEADYFALLGVRRDATNFEIRRAYQAARRDFAADCFPNDLRSELARELEDIASVLDEAFRVLRDDRLRGNYLSNLVE
jgi:hypothetical protein